MPVEGIRSWDSGSFRYGIALPNRCGCCRRIAFRLCSIHRFGATGDPCWGRQTMALDEERRLSITPLAGDLNRRCRGTLRYYVSVDELGTIAPLAFGRRGLPRRFRCELGSQYSLLRSRAVGVYALLFPFRGTCADDVHIGAAATSPIA